VTIESGQLVLARPTPAYRDLLRSYVIEVDGQRQGRLRLGRELRITMPAGRHRVRARIDWSGSDVTEVDVTAGAEVRLLVEPTGTALAFWQGFTRTGYLRLRQV
jgi:hypothetical protein